jgi:hypothetical protein
MVVKEAEQTQLLETVVKVVLAKLVALVVIAVTAEKAVLEAI